MAKKVAMNVLFAAAEVAPLAKAGGLADVAGALPKALTGKELDIRVIMPYYGFIDQKKYQIRAVTTFTLPFAHDTVQVTLYQTVLPESVVPLYLLAGSPYTNGTDIYYQTLPNRSAAERAQLERFLFFSQACIAALPHLAWWPDVIHCNDWHTAAMPYLLQHTPDKRCHAIATAYTIHNLALQGSIAPEQFARLTGMEYTRDWAQQAEHINITALGLSTSTMLSTVSPSYAQEILTPTFGTGLDSLLRKRQHDLVGILNGIDRETWNPATDPALPRTYAARNAADGKAHNKAFLRKMLHLRPDGPIFGMVSRLTEQKGIDPLCTILPDLVKLGGNIVILGSGESAFEKRVQQLATQHPSAISFTTGFNAQLANQIYAGSDFFLMPSRFEPCGLGQMIAMRYGTIPIVHAVGGLRDTVHEGPHGTGFVFTDFTPDAFLAACLRGLARYDHNEMWQPLVTHVMQQDFSWNASCPAYQALYQKAYDRHGKM